MCYNARMVDKYRGVIPEKSIWYHLSRPETMKLLNHRGSLAGVTSEEISKSGTLEIPAPPEKIEELETVLKDAGLHIVTLFD